MIRGLTVTDPGLRRLLKWVFAALVAVVLFAVIAVELTIRWLR
jgi:tetrahydromethanopterin S-methyltransferase subunit D